MENTTKLEIQMTQDYVTVYSDTLQTYTIYLAYNSRLVNFDITTLHIMSRNQQQECATHLDIARDAYTLEVRQWDHT